MGTHCSESPNSTPRMLAGDRGWVPRQIRKDPGKNDLVGKMKRLVD